MSSGKYAYETLVLSLVADAHMMQIIHLILCLALETTISDEVVCAWLGALLLSEFWFNPLGKSRGSG